MNLDVTGIAFFAAIVLIVFFGIKARLRRNQMEHEERMLAIEKGVEIPMTPATIKVRNPYVWPLVLIGIGVAIIVGLAASGDEDWAWGLLPMLIGAGMLVAHRIFRRQQEKRGWEATGEAPLESEPREPTGPL